MSRKLAVVLAGLVILGAAMVGLAQVTDGAAPEAHPLGTEVVVGHYDLSDGLPGVRTTIALKVLAVRTGTQEDLAASGLAGDPEFRGSTLWYVDARFRNLGPNPVSRTLSVGLEDSRGNLVPRSIALALRARPLESCPQNDEGMLAPGESYEACSLVLVPEGVEVARVEFLSDNGPDGESEFVYWATE